MSGVALGNEFDLSALGPTQRSARVAEDCSEEAWKIKKLYGETSEELTEDDFAVVFDDEHVGQRVDGRVDGDRHRDEATRKADVDSEHGESE